MRTPDYYAQLWDTMTVLPEWEQQAEWAARTVKAHACQYGGFGAHWRLIGVLHWMECGCDFRRQLLNGQPYDRVTTIEPRGLGPWASWRASTEAALARRAVRTLADLERWNGMGYARREVNSPYLWSGSNHGVGVGKYVADGRYDAAAVSKQVGAAVILFVLADGNRARLIENAP